MLINTFIENLCKHPISMKVRVLRNTYKSNEHRQFLFDLAMLVLEKKMQIFSYFDMIRNKLELGWGQPKLC